MTLRGSGEVPAEISQLFVKTSADLYAYAKTIPGVDHYAAEDLVQEAFHAAAVKWCVLAGRDVEGRRRWLFKVIHNKAIDRWRRGSREVVIPEPPEVPSSADPTAEHVLSVIGQERYWAVIGAMPPVRQKVAFLRWSGDWSTADIARWLGIEQVTVRGHLRKALEELRNQPGAEMPPVHDPEIDEGG